MFLIRAARASRGNIRTATEIVPDEMNSAGQRHAGAPAGAKARVGDGHTRKDWVGTGCTTLRRIRQPRVDHLDLKNKTARKMLKEHNNYFTKLNGQDRRV